MPTPLILVVEDRRTEQYVYLQLLKRFEFDVQVVSSAESALDAVKVADYSAILMDITLPGMNGIACTRQIREIQTEQGKYTPIIAVTAKTDKDTRKECLESGMDGYLTKPFSPEQLRLILTPFLEGSPSNEVRAGG